MLRVLVLSTLFPDASRPNFGIFVERQTLSLIYNMTLGGFNLTSFLDALSEQQLSDVQAEPSTTTVDNREAELFAGTQIAYLLTPPTVPGQLTQSGPQQQRQDVGITLRVTPHVTANHQVLMSVYAEQQSLAGATVAGPTINKRFSRNEVLVGDGETAVIDVGGVGYLVEASARTLDALGPVGEAIGRDEGREIAPIVGRAPPRWVIEHRPAGDCIGVRLVVAEQRDDDPLPSTRLVLVWERGENPRQDRLAAVPKKLLDAKKSYDVIVDTNCGSFTIRLDVKRAPHIAVQRALRARTLPRAHRVSGAPWASPRRRPRATSAAPGCVPSPAAASGPSASAGRRAAP